MEQLGSTLLVLIRHGQTATNAGGASSVMSGRTDLPLSATGRGQVARLSARLRGGARFAAIYASPLRRAWDTAEALEVLGPGRIVPLAQVREIDCGELDGRPIDEVRARYAALWSANLRQDDDDFRWPGGESYRELRVRSLGAMAWIAAHHGGARVAVVTHAGVIAQVVGALRGLPPARWEVFRPANTALTTIEWSGQDGRVVSFDDHAHLDAPSSTPHPPAG